MLYIFDWDGTLCDSTKKIVSSMQQAARDANGPALDDSTIENIIGLGLPEAIQSLYPELNPAQQEAIKSGYSKHYIREDSVQPSSLFPGVEEVLEKLKHDGFKLTIATGKSRKGLDRVLNQLGLKHFFHSSRCADETASKPHPLMIEEILDEMRMTPLDAVMVGDTEFDMAMANNAGIAKIAVSYGAHHLDRLKNHSPNLCIDRFSEIHKFEF